MLETKAAYESCELSFEKHAVAVTGNNSDLDKYAVSKKWLARFPMWDWVGGRYSLWSAIGLPLAIAIGAQGFRDFLAGAHAMEKAQGGTGVLIGGVPIFGVFEFDIFGTTAYAYSFTVTFVLVRMLGLEFLPKLEEGNLWIRATLPPTISLQEGNAYVNEMRRMIRARPEVESVVSQHGRPDDGTDAAGLFNAEFFAPLKPNSQWPNTHDKDELTAQLLALDHGSLQAPEQQHRLGLIRQSGEHLLAMIDDLRPFALRQGQIEKAVQRARGGVAAPGGVTTTSGP